MTNLTYNDPERDVRIDTAYRGDIRCRKLTVTAKGSVVGNIEAFDVRNHGRIQGIVNASDVFINSENAVMRGSVFAPHLGTHPNSTFECSTSNRIAFRTDTTPLLPTPSALERAIQQGVTRELAKVGLTSDHQGFSISANEVFRTPDSSQPPLSAEAPQVTDFVWAPPVETRKAFSDGREYTLVGTATPEDSDNEPETPVSMATGDEIGFAPSPVQREPVAIATPEQAPAPMRVAHGNTIRTRAEPASSPTPAQRRPLPPLFAGTN